jgi:RNA polymerase sigma factor (sigma-70 family)
MNRASQPTTVPVPIKAGPRFDRYDEVVPRLRRTALKQLPDALRGVWEVDALINEALAKALESFRRKREADPTHPDFFELPVEAMRKYLRAAIVDVAVDLTRRLLHQKGPGGPVPTLAFDPVADHTSPSERARRSETLAQLGRGLAELLPEQYQAIRLHYLEGLSYLETARQMETTTAAVAGLIRRGLASLREQLPERDFGSNDDH